MKTHLYLLIFWHIYNNAWQKKTEFTTLILYTRLPLGQWRFIWLIKASRLWIPRPGSKGSWGIPYDRPDKFLLFQFFSASSASSSQIVSLQGLNGVRGCVWNGCCLYSDHSTTRISVISICIYTMILYCCTLEFVFQVEMIREVEMISA